MKKILVALLLFSGIVNAQNESTISDKKNEFRVDVLSAILSSKISVSYERFFTNDFSVGLNVICEPKAGRVDLSGLAIRCHPLVKSVANVHFSEG